MLGGPSPRGVGSCRSGKWGASRVPGPSTPSTDGPMVRRLVGGGIQPRPRVSAKSCASLGPTGLPISPGYPCQLDQRHACRPGAQPGGPCSRRRFGPGVGPFAPVVPVQKCRPGSESGMDQATPGPEKPRKAPVTPAVQFRHQCGVHILPECMIANSPGGRTHTRTTRQPRLRRRACRGGLRASYR